MMNYQEAVNYIEEIPKFAVKHPKEHTREFLKRLGNPEQGLRIIHVAGTNGKGSVCAYMQAMLMAEGKRTGFFTSPHLVSMNERIRLNNRQITNEQFLDVFQKVKAVVDEMAEEGISHPSYFEFLFGMGMTVFAEEMPDYVILETGLGGRLDATNSVEHPVLSIITSISLDHTQYLGSTIAEIAGEKAGIIKENVPVICDGSNPGALEVIRRQAAKCHADCREITNDAFEIREITDKHIAFSRVNAYDEDVTWRLKNSGVYQMMNASIAIAAMEYLAGNPEKEQYHIWQKALESVVWEGRMEEVIPGLFVDGAHNPGAIEAFVESVKAVFASGCAGTVSFEEAASEQLILVFSAVADKEYEQMIACLCQNLPAKAYIVTEITDSRKVPADVLEGVFRKYTDRPVYSIPDVTEACRKAIGMRPEGGRVYCLGSLYLVGTVKKWLTGGKSDVEL